MVSMKPLFSDLDPIMKMSIYCHQGTIDERLKRISQYILSICFRKNIALTEHLKFKVESLTIIYVFSTNYLKS